MNHAPSTPLPVVRRLPAYLDLARMALLENRAHISSTVIARELGLTSIQVRKDLSQIGLTGLPRLGFEIAGMVDAIEMFLGWDNATDVFVVGAGNLGSALAGYEGFRTYGLNITALFDTDPAVVGSIIHGRTVFDVTRIVDLAWRMHVHMGILAVSPDAAQKTAELMADAGIVAIWNFTPAALRVPDGVIVEKVDLAASLAVLSNRLAELLTTKRRQHDAG